MEEYKTLNIDEAEVTKAIVEGYAEDLKEFTEYDVIIVGTGPSGTVAAAKLAAAGVKTLLVERNIKPGGGMYLGGMMMNKLVVEAPAHKICLAAGAKSLKEYRPGLYVGDAYEVATKLLADAFDKGAKMINGVQLEDIITRGNRVVGAVLNWHMISSYPSWVTCVDPLPFKSKLVIDATGHAAEVAKLTGLRFGFEVKQKEGAMHIDEAEKATIEHTSEIFPGLIVCGMAANGTYMLPRMGPIFGAMFLSGQKAAEIALEKLAEMKKKEKVQVATIKK